ncbi:hypothetical protein ES705_19461 [subsurface metagenome]
MPTYTSQYPPVQSETYVKATTYYSTSYYPHLAIPILRPPTSSAIRPNSIGFIPLTFISAASPSGFGMCADPGNPPILLFSSSHLLPLKTITGLW